MTYDLLWAILALIEPQNPSPYLSVIIFAAARYVPSALLLCNGFRDLILHF